jgi:hypothetical protein
MSVPHTGSNSLEYAPWPITPPLVTSILHVLWGSYGSVVSYVDSIWAPSQFDDMKIDKIMKATFLEAINMYL